MRDWASKAHPFFWLLGLLFVPAVVAAFATPGRAPGYALDSAWLYRLEVGGAFYLGSLLVALTLWLAYSGRTFGDFQLPGGAGMSVPPPDPDLDDAAEGLAGYKQKTDERLRKLEENIELLTSPDEPDAQR